MILSFTKGRQKKRDRTKKKGNIRNEKGGRRRKKRVRREKGRRNEGGAMQPKKRQTGGVDEEKVRGNGAGQIPISPSIYFRAGTQ